MEVRHATLLDDDAVLISSGFNTVDVWSLREGRRCAPVPISKGRGATTTRERVQGAAQHRPVRRRVAALGRLATGERIESARGARALGLARGRVLADGARLATLARHCREVGTGSSTGRKLTRALASGVADAGVLRDGRRLLTATADNGLALWDPRHADTCTNPIRGLSPEGALLPDGGTLALLRSGHRADDGSLAEGRTVAVRAGWLRLDGRPRTYLP